MGIQELSPDEFLGPLNEVEKRHAPPRLFVAGDTTIVRVGARAAVVGSRKASGDGIKRAAKLARFLVERGVVVVSGLAEGIDTVAHSTAMEHGGKTIAVIGTPLDQVYPRKNRQLQDRIIREQLCVSQFPPGYPVQRKNFPQRNRTMALVSDATVIIEASDTSGSLSQGWEALRLGRGLFIAKGVADDAKLSWPAEMLVYGAQILSDDTLEDFFSFLPLRTEATFDGAIPL